MTLERGQKYDYFGQIWEVCKVRGRYVDIKRVTFDNFGKSSTEEKSVHVSAIAVMRLL